MKFTMGQIHVNKRNAVLVLRTNIPKSTDILNRYCSMLGRVLTHKMGKEDCLTEACASDESGVREPVGDN